MKIFQFIWLFLLTAFISNAYSQDTIKAMHYNLMYYGKNTSFCDQTNNNIEFKNANLRKIIEYVQPDIFSVNELDGDNTTPEEHDEIYLLNRALNTSGVDNYKTVPYKETYLANTLFYNKNKLSFHSYAPVRMYLGDFEKIFNIYTFHYKSSDLAENSDTTFLTCIVVHLKAGDNYSNTRERKEETDVLMDYITSKLPHDGNYLLLGDLNIYYPGEAAFQNLINPADSAYRFYDPANAIGEWHNNSEYAGFHTQSTHIYGDCFSGGGMDDRFDFILASKNIMDSTNTVTYIPGSYSVVGQDGTTFNSSLNRTGNERVPDSIAEALYNFSDHLPVTLELKVNKDRADVLSIDSIFVQPQTPSAGDSIYVFSEVSDTRDVLDHVHLTWRKNGSSTVQNALMKFQDMFYTAAIPSPEEGDTIKYSIEGYDAENNIILESKEEIFSVDESTSIQNRYLSGEKTVIIRNPVRDQLKILLNFPASSMIVQMGSVNGRIVLNRKIKVLYKQEITLPVHRFKPGVYWIRIFEENQLVTTSKVIIIN